MVTEKEKRAQGLRMLLQASKQASIISELLVAESHFGNPLVHFKAHTLQLTVFGMCF